jgi:hypothetical protein
MTDRIHIHKQYQLWLSSSAGGGVATNQTKHSAITTFGTDRVTQSSAPTVPPISLPIPLPEQRQDREPLRSTSTEASLKMNDSSKLNVSSVTFNVRRSVATNEVVEHKYSFFWPKHVDGRFIQRIYVSMVGGGDGGSGAVHLSIGDFCNAMSSLTLPEIGPLKVTLADQVDPESAMIGAGGAGGGSSAMTKCLAIECPVGNESSIRQLLVEVEVGRGGDAGKNISISSASFAESLKAAPKKKTFWHGEAGTLGQPSKITISQFDGHPIHIQTSHFQHIADEEFQKRAGTVTFDWPVRLNRICRFFKSRVKCDVMEVECVARGGQVRSNTQLSTSVASLLAHPGLVVASPAARLLGLHVGADASTDTDDSDDDAYVGKLVTNNPPIESHSVEPVVSGGKSVLDSQTSGFPSSQVLHQVTTFDDTVGGDNVSLHLAGIEGGSGGCHLLSKHHMATTPDMLPIGSVMRLRAGIFTSDEDAIMLNQTFVVPKSTSSTGYPWAVTSNAVKSAWRLPSAGMNSSVELKTVSASSSNSSISSESSMSDSVQLGGDAIFAYGGAGAWTAHLISNPEAVTGNSDDQRNPGEGGHGGAVAFNHGLIAPDISLEPIGGADGRIVVYWINDAP